MAQSDAVLLEVRADGVGVLTLNRAESGNAWSAEMEARYFELLDECVERDDVRAVVVTGAGRAWCVGVDVAALQTAASASTARRRDVATTADYPIPVIAAINGACAGRGLVQAMFCDLRFASRAAKLTTSFARRGLVAEHGSAWLLPRMIGVGAAMDLLLSGRVVLGDEAERLGLVDRSCEPEQVLSESIAYAADLAANCSPSSMAAIKRQLWSGLVDTWPEARMTTRTMMAAASKSPDFPEGIASFQERRPPAFGGRIASWTDVGATLAWSGPAEGGDRS